jgi:GT2 family glycosyltransferase
MSTHDMKSRVSIIIPHFNGIKIISECLDSLQQRTATDTVLEIIVVDNASTDDSVAVVKKRYPAVSIIKSETNRGYAGGCNLGADAATGDYLVFLNNDTVHEIDWIEPLTELMDGDPLLAAVQPKILNHYERDRFDYAGGSGGAMDVLGYPFARGRLFMIQEKDTGQYDDEKEIFWASGTAIMVRKKSFLEAGGFDEVFFAHMEEIDLCWRFHLMGLRIMCQPRSVIYHKNAVTLPMYSRKKYYLNHRNSIIMVWANYSLPTAIYLFAFRYFLEWVALGYSLTKWDWAHVGGIIQAHTWLLFHPHIICRKRRHVKQVRRLKDGQVMAKMYRSSAVLAHYLGGLKTYGEMASRAGS